MGWHPQQQQPQWSPPPRCALPKKPTGVWVWLLAGAVGLGTTSCLQAILVGGQGKASRAHLWSQNERAEELRAALDGDAKVTATDNTCRKLTCETVSTEHYDGITRVVANGNPIARSIVMLHVDIDDVVAPANYVASCSRTWIVTDGPLEKLIVMVDDSGTHFVTAAYLHPSTGHGFTAAQMACVDGLIR